MQRQVEGFSKEPVCSEFTCLVLKVNVAKSRHFFIHVEFISEAGGGGAVPNVRSCKLLHRTQIIFKMNQSKEYYYLKLVIEISYSIYIYIFLELLLSSIL